MGDNNPRAECEWIIPGFGVATDGEVQQYLAALDRAREAIREVARFSRPAAQSLLDAEAALLRRDSAPKIGRPPRAPSDGILWAGLLGHYEKLRPGLSAPDLAQAMLTDGVIGLAQSKEALAKQISRIRAEASRAGGYDHMMRRAVRLTFSEVIAGECGEYFGSVIARLELEGPSGLTAPELALARLLLDAVSDDLSHESGAADRT